MFLKRKMLSAKSVCFGICDVVRGYFKLSPENHEPGKGRSAWFRLFWPPFNESIEGSMPSTVAGSRSDAISNFANVERFAAIREHLQRLPRTGLVRFAAKTSGHH